MKDINELVKSANKALRLIENGSTYTSHYVMDRFEKAAEKNPQDQLIGNMRDVIRKTFSNSEFVTQAQISKIYDEMYGISGGVTAFRRDLGDLIPDGHGIVTHNKKSYAKNRDDFKTGVSSRNEDLNELENALSSVFSLNSGSKPGYYSENIYRRAENLTRAQLKSVGFEPQSVRAIENNNHFILCVASYNTPEFVSVDVKIPVQIVNNSASMPTKMICEGELVDITKEAMYLGIKEGAWSKTQAGINKFAGQRGQEPVRVPRAVTPSGLEEFANLENELVAASSKFTRDEILLANKLVSSELYSMGVPNPQVKVSSSNNREISFSASIPTEIGRVKINIPVEIHNGRPTIPSKFSYSNSSGVSTYEFNETGVGGFLRSIVSSQKIDTVSRDYGDLNNASYHNLMDSIIDGVSRKDYKSSEDALMVIQSRFSSEKYISALNKFSELLRASSEDSERDQLVRDALERGDLIRVSTSVEPYSPKLGLPLRKIDFDSKGRPIPMRRAGKASNLRESGAHISTSKIFLS
tara:strand:- start:124 stop:1698 length:1575 start_codon:yes stop_codon:yes gene_type:complete